MFKSKSVSMVYKEGILIGKFNPNLVISIIEAKEVVELRKTLTNNKVTPILVDARDVAQVSKEARNYFSSHEGTELLSAAAIIVESKFSAFLANFFIKVNLSRSELPIKLFTDKNEALNWLQQYK